MVNWKRGLLAFGFSTRGTFQINPLSRRDAVGDNMADKNDILSLDARTLSDQLRSGHVTAVQLMEATLERVNELNPSLRALISLRKQEDLLEEARTSDTTKPRKGWLHGIPIAIKDLSNAAGFPTTMGGCSAFSLNNNNNIATENDIFVQRLLDAGGIIISKSNCPECGLGSHTFNSQWGTTVNPYDYHKSAGGSSGGAAVALSSRMLCLADGSDMMGSLRNPAGWNNIYSHRPTAAMIDNSDAAAVDDNPLPYPISTVGPMARTPLDLARLLETMAGGSEVFDASLLSEDPEEDVRGMRIGWLADWNSSYPMETGILSLCRNALDVFARDGHVSVELVSEPPMAAEQLWKSWTTIRSKIVSNSLISTYGEDALIKAEEQTIKPEAQWEVKRGQDLSEKEIREAVHLADKWSSCAAKMFEKYDALALPTAQVWPFPAEWRWPKSIAGKSMDTYHRWMEVVVPCSLGGLPCVTIPAGFGEEGLPMGIQLFGARGADARLLSLAQYYHKKTDWPSKSPPRIPT